MKKALVIIGLVAVIGGLGLWGLEAYFRSVSDHLFARDAAQVLCYHVHDMLEEGKAVDQAAVDNCLKMLYDASVINIKVTPDGTPTDYYGNRFHASWKTVGETIDVTITTAGPDGKEGTDDDIVFTYDLGFR